MFMDVYFKTQNMCDKAFSEDSSKLKYCFNLYKAPKMCDKAVDNFLSTLKFVPDWFVSKKTIKSVFTTLFADDDLLFFDEDSGNITFLSNETDILSVNFNNINLDEVKIYEDDPKTNIHVRLFVWHYRYKQRKLFKKEISEN